MTAPLKKRPRDLRLDFFRGLGMFIIFIAHVPNNSWNDWIPARFGASDATEIFVFCSGMASAIAFGSVFRDRSFLLGTSRTGCRAVGIAAMKWCVLTPIWSLLMPIWRACGSSSQLAS